MYSNSRSKRRCNRDFCRQFASVTIHSARRRAAARCGRSASGCNLCYNRQNVPSFHCDALIRHTTLQNKRLRSVTREFPELRIFRRCGRISVALNLRAPANCRSLSLYSSFLTMAARSASTLTGRLEHRASISSNNFLFSLPPWVQKKATRLNFDLLMVI